MVLKDILKLDDVRKGDVALAGGKGANLGELLGKGFPVPTGFVVSARACEKFFKAIDLERKCRSLGDGGQDELDKQCSAIRDRIVRADPPRELSEAIMAEHEELVKNRGSEVVYAVRSSATAEDLGDASFAGIHRTYYYVGRNSLLEMIKHCWASLWSQEALSYRATHGIDHSSVFMAAVVQEMILSEISGVTFTANPVTGFRDEIVTESSWGMGAAIVDGRVTPDRYVMARQGLRLSEKRISEKRFMVLPFLDRDAKTRLKEVPHEMRHKETLSNEQVRNVSEWSLKAEEHFGSPQDVEWAISEGRFYMLQSRPITVMGRREIGRDVRGKYVLFKALAENFTEPLTPLTADLMATETPFGIRFIQGWIYTSLKFLRAVLPVKTSDEELADLMYLSHGSQPPPMRLSLIKLPFFLFVLFMGYLVFGVLLARTRGMPDDFMDKFRDLCKKVEEDPAFGPEETLSRLWAWSWKRFFEPVGHMAILVNLSAVRYGFWMALLKKAVHRWVPDVREDAADLLCSGTEGVLSADMGRGILALARLAKSNGRVRELFERHRPEKLLAELGLEPKAREFLDQLNLFLASNGHRALKELELRSVRWEENPAPVLGMVRNYLLVESDPLEHEKKMDRIRSELKEEIQAELRKSFLDRTFALRWHLIRFMANQTRYFTKLRENSRFYHIMAFNIVRKKILEIESEFMNQGELKCKDDIFFLKRHEIAMMREGRLGWLDVEGRIRERRMEHIRLSKMVPPKTIGITVEERPESRKPSADGATVLRGQSASPGIYEGLAHVILDPSVDIELKPGEILVAPYTDPAWTPLFLTAGAAVVGVGSYLSHAGTVAREFGMPCVVDVADCTRCIQTGFHLEVDGDLGLVRMIPDRGEEKE